jgi:hypothetical protein
MPALVNDTAKVWNVPNYSGQLYTAAALDTPFLYLIGGQGGARAMRTTNFEFPVASTYDLPDPAQPAISENDSMIAPTPTSIARDQATNVTQIFHERVSVTYVKESNTGRLSGINTAGQQNNVQDEVEWQTQRKLEKISRDIEYTFLNGVYAVSTSSATANKTRGIIAAAGTVVHAGTTVESVTTPGELTRNLINSTFKTAWDNGARFSNFYIFCNGFQKMQFTKIYNEITGFNLPDTRNSGGLNITSFMTDFAEVSIVVDKFMPADKVLGVEIGVVSPVEQDTPGKGNFFREELSRVGATTDYQIFGQIGLNHGPGFLHFVIDQLTTS